MRLVLGPVDALGHPFFPHPRELVVERRVGDHELYCFSEFWLGDGPEVLMDGIDAVVLFDPMWVCVPDNLAKLERYIAEWNVPVVGIFGDWFVGLKADRELYCGTERALTLCDHVLTDRSGAAALRTVGYRKPIATRQEILTYGRLLRRGGDDDLVRTGTADSAKKWDVSFVGHRYPQAVINRAFYLEAVHEICDRRGWSFFESDEVPYDELEDVICASRVTFNHSVGSMLNCRVYEAAACQSALLTDMHNVDNGLIKGFGRFYGNVEHLEIQLDFLLDGGAWKDKRDAEIFRLVHTIYGAHWAVERSPTRTWEKNLEACEALLREGARV